MVVQPVALGDIAWLSFLLIPAVFGFVWLALPLWDTPLPRLLAYTAACGVAAVILQWTGAGVVANFAKLAAMTFGAWCFLRFFEELSWVVLVACIVPFVDSYSVWRGPTKTIVTQKPRGLLGALVHLPRARERRAARSSACPTCSSSRSSSARPRAGSCGTGWTWLCLTASIGGTIALATWLEVDGLPALPLLALGFLLPNADLLWRAVRDRGARGHPRSPR